MFSQSSFHSFWRYLIRDPLSLLKLGTVHFQCQLKGRVIIFKGNNGFHPCYIKTKFHLMDHSSSSGRTKKIRRCLRAPRQNVSDQGDWLENKYPEEMESGSEKVAPSENRHFIMSMTYSILKAFFSLKSRWQKTVSGRSLAPTLGYFHWFSLAAAWIFQGLGPLKGLSSAVPKL